MVIRGPDGQIIPPSAPSAPPVPPARPAPPAPAASPRPKPAARPAPPSAAPAAADEPPATVLRGPTPDEILADPLVRTVLDVFQGEVKRIHPRPPRTDGGSEE
jgi:hypothetical protein